jgi:hypothetical protein
MPKGRSHRVARIVALSVLLIGAGAQPARAVTLDFEIVPTPTSPGPVLTTQGFTFQAGGDAAGLVTADGTTPGGASNGSNYLFAIAEAGTGSGSRPVVLTEGTSSEPGLPFTLVSFDATELLVATPGDAVRVAAGDADGNLIADHTFAFDGVIDGPGGEPDFQTFLLPAGFENVSFVTFLGVDLGSGSDFFAIDNLVVVVVPEPTSLVLLTSAVTLLATTRRHTSNSGGRESGKRAA